MPGLFSLGIYQGAPHEAAGPFVVEDCRQHHANTWYLNGGAADLEKLLDLSERVEHVSRTSAVT